MRFPSTWLLVGALAIALPARAATELVISAPGYTLDGETLHGSRTLRFAAPVDAFEVHSIRLDPFGHPQQTTEGVLINFHDPAFKASYTLQFVPPIGQTYTVGDYEGVLSYEIFQEHPGMSVDGFGPQCRAATAHYTVLEVRYDDGGHIVRFSADFTLACQGAGNRVVTGSVRVAAGDDTCIAAADGVSCDDLDACTPTSTCVANRCVGASAITCPASPDVCRDPEVCAPSLGECLAPTFAPNGLPCDDGSVCTDSDRCGLDGCAGVQAISCRDDDQCTADLCDPVRGCVHPPAGGHCGNPGAPSTYLFVASPSGEPVGRGRNTAIVPADDAVATFVESRNGIEVRYHDEFFDYWSIFLGAPAGASLRAGSYSGSRRYSNVGDLRRPVLGVSGPGSALCDTGTGNFIVRDIAVSSVDGAFTLDTLVAELEFHCTPESPALTAVVRYHAGDAGCHGATDGTPCDDASACTSGDHCEREVCVGGTPTVCAAATGCSDASLCHPITGACLPAFVFANDAECSDPDACVPEGTCQGGVCTPQHDMCDDFDVCTTDGCDGGGHCVHGPIAGSCWARRGSVTIFATALGHTCSCTTRASLQPLALYDDGHFAFPGGPATCQGTPIIVPEESGTWTRHGRRLALSTTNLPDLIELAQQCGQSNVPNLTRYHTTIQLLRGGRRLRGTHVERARSGGSTSVQVTTVTRFRGAPTTSGRANLSATKLGRCEGQLIGCLRAAISND